MLRLLILLTIVFNFAIAQDEEEFAFIGLGSSYSLIEFEGSSNQEESSIGLRYGKQNIDYRTIFAYSGNSNLNRFDLEIDRIFNHTINGLEHLRLYFGGVVGLLEYNKAKEAQKYKRYYGANVGLLYYLTDRIDIDLSYHYYKINELEPLLQMQGITFSLHYFYN